MGNAEYMGRVYLFSFCIRRLGFIFLKDFSNGWLFIIDKNIE